MGVIKRQSIKYSLVNVVGLAIGTLSNFFVYPYVLEANGLFRVFMDTGIVLLSLLTLGANTLTIRFFPKFQDNSKQHNGFLPLILGMSGVGCLLFSLVVWMGKDAIVHHLDKEGKSPLLREYIFFVVPIAALFVFNQVLYFYSANFKRIVVPSILTDFSYKIVVPLLLIGVWQGWISIETALYGLVFHGFLVFLGLSTYLKWLGEWRWGNFSTFITPELRKEMQRYALFGVISGLCLMVSAKFDTIMVGYMIELKDVSLFAISAQIAAIIEIPTKGIYSASVSSVARYLEDDNKKELGELYQKVSINLLVAGLLLFFSIWVSIDYLYLLIPKGEIIKAGKWVFFFIGLSKLAEMATGMNNNIIYYSKYYTWSIASLAVSAVASVLFNLWLIPIFGIVGAALATLLSVVTYNAFTVALVWAKFRLQPFSKSTLVSIFLAIIAYCLAFWIPSTGNAFFDIIVHSGAFLLVFVFLVYKTDVAPEMSELVKKGMKIKL